MNTVSSRKICQESIVQGLGAGQGQHWLQKGREKAVWR